MAVQTANGKSQGAADDDEKTGTGKSIPMTERQGQVPEENPEQDIVKVRGKIDNMVKSSAEEITGQLIAAAKKTSQLATAKYLFEAVGLYPAAKETAGAMQGDPLAEALLRRLGMPTAPAQPAPASDTKRAGEAELAKEYKEDKVVL